MERPAVKVLKATRDRQLKKSFKIVKLAMFTGFVFNSVRHHGKLFSAARLQVLFSKGI